MGKKLQIILSALFLAAAIAVTQFPASDAQATQSRASDFQLEGTTLVKYNGTAVTVSIPESVKTIGQNAFAEDADLYSVEIPEGVEVIEDGAFSHCSLLTNVNIPDSLRKIGAKAFEDCVGLKTVSIPASVTEINPTAFDGCYNMKISAQDGSAAAQFALQRDTSNVAQREYQEADAVRTTTDASMDELIQGILEENGLTEENEDSGTGTAVNKLLGETSIVGSTAVVFIDNSSENVLSGTNAITQDDGGGVEDVSGNDALNADSNDVIEEKGGQFPKYTLVGDEIIANQAFYMDSSLTSYDIPETVTEIGEFAFARSALTNITIPEGVTEIGYGAFYHCDDLENIVIPASVQNIAPAAFEKTKWLGNWRLSTNAGDYNIVGDGILIAYKGKDSKIEVPEGVKQIGPEVFKDHKGITNVSLPSSLTVIGEDAFAGCTNLKSFSGGSNISAIKDRAFAGCPLETVRIPASVTQIGLKAFDVSETVQSDKNTAVVFIGKSLPAVSYEDTATRLSNSGYRDLCLKGINVAVVDASIENFDGTVLSKEQPGFRGLVCSIVQEADKKTKGILKIKQCTVLPDNAGSIVLPVTVKLYGKEYEFENIEATKTLMEPEAEQETDREKTITVRINSTVLTDDGKAAASLAGNTGDYAINIIDSENAQNILTKAYRTIYGDNTSSQITAFDISMKDEKTGIPVTRLGKLSVNISIPLPLSVSGTPTVVCTDENGQLERVESQVVSVEGANHIEFQAKHFSPYGIYTYNSGVSAVIKDGNASFIQSFRKLDESPDTGDFIDPRYLLAIGLFAVSCIIFLWKGNRLKDKSFNRFI